MLWTRALLDFTVWDNDGAYALVTFASLAFAIVLIVTVSRQSKARDRVTQQEPPAAQLPEATPKEPLTTP